MWTQTKEIATQQEEEREREKKRQVIIIFYYYLLDRIFQERKKKERNEKYCNLNQLINLLNCMHDMKQKHLNSPLCVWSISHWILKQKYLFHQHLQLTAFCAEKTFNRLVLQT